MQADPTLIIMRPGDGGGGGNPPGRPLLPRFDSVASAADLPFLRLHAAAGAAKSALEVFHPYEWNRLPEIDLEYARLFNKLRDCGKFPKISWIVCKKSLSHRDYCVTAKAIANDLNIEKLSEFDIEECLEDVFMEVDVECMLNFEKEYDFFLLDCFLEKKWPKDTDVIYPPPNTFHGPFPSCAVIQQKKFLRWMNGLKDRNLEKAELEKLLTRHREEVERECCATRIRYVKFKRALAKQLRLISDEID